MKAKLRVLMPIVLAVMFLFGGLVIKHLPISEAEMVVAPAVNLSYLADGTYKLVGVTDQMEYNTNSEYFVGTWSKYDNRSFDTDQNFFIRYSGTTGPVKKIAARKNYAVTFTWDGGANKSLKIKTDKGTYIDWGDGNVEYIPTKLTIEAITHSYETTDSYTVKIADNVVKYLDCNDSLVSVLDLTYNTKLTELHCSNNNITSLNLSKNTVLTDLYVNNNKLSRLDLINNALLTHVSCVQEGIDPVVVLKSQFEGYVEDKETVVDSITGVKKLYKHEDTTASYSTLVIPSTPTVTPIKNDDGTYRLEGYTDKMESNTIDPTYGGTWTSYTENNLQSIDFNKTYYIREAAVRGISIASLAQTVNVEVVKALDNGNGTSRIEGMKVGFEYQTATNSTWIAYTEENAEALNMITVSDTYYIRKATDTENVITVPVTVVPAVAMFGTGPSPKITLTYNITEATEKTIYLTVLEDTEIDWGDGKKDAVTDGGGEYTHEYVVGVHTVTIPGNVVKYLNVMNEDFDEEDEPINCITSLNVSNNTVLEELDCTDNNITELIIENNENLRRLDCWGNQLGSLDVSKNTKLEELNCSYNNIPELIIENNENLRSLRCWGNQLGSLDVSKNTKLEELDCSYNNITALDISNNSALTSANLINAEMRTLLLTPVQNALVKAMEIEEEEYENIIYVHPNTKRNVIGNEEVYTITFNANDGTGNTSTQIFAQNQAQNLTANIYVREGYKFLGWSTTDNGVAEYADKVSYTATSNATLYAVWEIVDYTITYDLAEGALETENPATYTVEDETITLINPTKEGYTFVGWIEEGVEGIKLTATIEKGSTGNKTFIATWELIDTTSAITFTWDTTGQKNKYITIMTSGATTIDWGDGSNNTEVLANHNGRIDHLYQEEGIYTVKIADDVVYQLDIVRKEGAEEKIVKNKVSELNVEKATILGILWCNNNNLNALDVSSNENLKDFNCGNNEIKSLDVTNNKKLTHLFCYENKLSTLDISSNINLVKANLIQESLKTLVLTEEQEAKLVRTTDFEALTEDKIYIHPNTNATMYTITYNLDGGSIETNNPENYTEYTDTFALNTPTKDGYNFVGWTGSNGETPELTVTIAKGSTGDRSYTANWEIIDTTSAINFIWDTTEQLDKWIIVSTNGATTIDWGDGNTETLEAGLDSKKIIHTYTEGLGEVTVRIADDVITTFSLQRQSVENETYITENNKVKFLDVRRAIALTTLNCTENQIKELDVSNNKDLTYIGCSMNELTALNVKEVIALENLQCHSNQLTTLDLSTNINLETLQCSVNNLTTLDVSSNVKLSCLECLGNNLTELNLTENAELGRLTCFSNQINELDLSKCVKLEELFCHDNRLTELDISKNTKLTSITASQESMQKLYVNKEQMALLENTEAVHENTELVLVNKTFKITIVSGENGKVTPSGIITAKEGAWEQIFITPDRGYKVSDVLVNGRSVGAVEIYFLENITRNYRVEVKFEEIPRESVGGSGGASRAPSSNISQLISQGIISSSWRNKFTDISKEDWHYSVVEFVNERNYFSGITETTFAPNEPMTREMFVAVLYNMAGKPITYGENNYYDVPYGYWSEASIVWANKMGLVNGYPDGNFMPGKPITRQEVATILKKYAEHENKYSLERDDLVGFNDTSDVEWWAKDSIGWAVAKGIMKGDTYKCILPQKSATRAEVAAMIMNYCKMD